MRKGLWFVLILLALCSMCWGASAEDAATPSNLAASTTETTPAEPPASKHTKRKPTLYEIPAEALEADEDFAALMAEAEKYIWRIREEMQCD